MKKYFICFLTLLVANTLLAQNDSIKRFREMTEVSKSGNYKEVFSSIFQLGTANLTSEDKSVEFNSTLFGIKSIFNNDLLEDRYFVKERFSRNLQFNMKLNLNEQFKYNGVSGGITYAVINKKDKDVANFTGTILNYKFVTLIDRLKEVIFDLVNQGLISDEEMVSIMDDLPILLNNGLDKINNTNVFIKKIIPEFDKRNKPIKLKDYINSLDELRKNAYSEIEKKPLWTVSLLGTTDDKGDNQNLTFGTVFLKGFKSFEMDLRSNLIYSDTLIDTSIKRTQLKSSAGINYKLLKREKSKESLFEIKLYMEYNSILKNVFADEKKNTFLASSDFRIRIAKDVWVPITVKYDIENSNFLGFFNITYNFGKPDENGKLKLNK